MASSGKLMKCIFLTSMLVRHEYEPFFVLNRHTESYFIKPVAVLFTKHVTLPKQLILTSSSLALLLLPNSACLVKK